MIWIAILVQTMCAIFAFLIATRYQMPGAWFFFAALVIMVLRRCTAFLLFCDLSQDHWLMVVDKMVLPMIITGCFVIAWTRLFFLLPKWIATYVHKTLNTLREEQPNG